MKDPKTVVTIIHKQRFFPKERIFGAETLPGTTDKRYVDIPIGTKVNVVRVENGSYLCEYEGAYGWISASWVSYSDNNF